MATPPDSIFGPGYRLSTPWAQVLRDQARWALVNVRDWGARGDGITDDTTAIQAALNAGVGRDVYLPAGTYLISQSLVIPSGTRLLGAGSATTTVTLANDANVTMITTVPDPVDIHIAYLALDGNRTNQTAGDGIDFVYSTTAVVACSVEACHVTNTYGAGINLGTANNRCQILQCVVEQTGDHGIGGGVCTDLRIVGCLVRDTLLLNPSDVGAITIFNTVQRGEIRDCVITHAGTATQTYGIFVQSNTGNPTTDVVITGCLIDVVGMHGISIYANGGTIDDVAITNCTVRQAGASDPTGAGVYCVVAASSMTNVSVVGCQINMAGGYGIEVAGATQVTVAANHVVACSDPGIYLACTSFTCTGNYSNNPGGGFGFELNGCSHGVVAGNIAELNAFGGIGITGPSADHLLITGNVCLSNGGLSGGQTWEYSGIVLNPTAAATDCTISDNIVGDTQTTKTQIYGIYEANGTDNIIADNDVRGNKTTNLLSTGTGTVIRHNTGYNDVQTTVTGTTAGSFVASMPDQAPTHKKVLIWLDGYENDTTTAQTYTFPMGFTETPAITTNSASVPGVSVSTSALSLAPDTTTAYTGWLVVEGY